jgi:F-type H+-transporting ATPase subunit b
MLIDWFTVGAQILNFAILVWLLKRFLYRPILNAVDAREKYIAKAIADAEAKKSDAEKLRTSLETKNIEFEQRRASLLSKAADEATAERVRLLDEAHKAAEALGAKRQQTLRSEARTFNQKLRRQTQHEVFGIARKVLSELAEANLDEQMVSVFIKRLQTIDEKAKQVLADALKVANPALVRSVFELPIVQQDAIRKAIDQIFGGQFQLTFEIAPDLVGGIEISAGGQKVAWSIAEYLGSLEKSIDSLTDGGGVIAPAPASS